MTTNDKVYAFMQTIVTERCLAGFIHGHTAEDLLDEMTAERVPPWANIDTNVSNLPSAPPANVEAQAAQSEHVDITPEPPKAA